MMNTNLFPQIFKQIDHPTEIDRKLANLEPLAPLALALHGAIMLFFMGGELWQWVAIGSVFLFGAWGLSKWGQSKQAVLIRAGLIFSLTWMLLLTTKGVGSFFLLWYFILITVYPLVLPAPFALILVVTVPVSYLLLWPVSSQPIPLTVVLARAFLLTFLGWLIWALGAAVRHYILERNQAEETLRESEIRFRATFEQAAVGIAHVKPEGQWLRVNQKLCDIVGYSREELLELTFQDITHPDDLAIDLEHTGRLISSEIETFSREKRYHHKDGAFVWVNLTVALMRDSAGEPDYFITVVQDITERKRLEAQYQQAQKMEAIGHLAGGIAHDFNNILVPIIGYSELAMMNLPPASELHADLSRIKKAADRATDLIRQILAFSRKQMLEMQVLDLNTVVTDFQKMIQRLIGEDIELQTWLASDLYRVKVDKNSIEQVLMNLIINARDAMPTGGKLTIETANIYLDEAYVKKYAGTQAPGHYAMLAIGDTGHGMDTETQQQIFEPFFTTKERGKGTGLGLATVFGIVKQHQGNIWVYSEPGNGTTFKIYLPQAEETTPSSNITTPDPISVYGTETVLVAEDEEMVRQLVCETLAAHGYQVLETNNPAHCLRLAKGYQEAIHLLLTDVIMPEMNGVELYQNVIGVYPDIKVLYISGYTDDMIVHHGILDQGVNFLQKPFTIRALTQKVRKVLG